MAYDMITISELVETMTNLGFIISRTTVSRRLKYAGVVALTPEQTEQKDLRTKYFNRSDAYVALGIDASEVSAITPVTGEGEIATIESDQLATLTEPTNNEFALGTVRDQLVTDEAQTASLEDEAKRILARGEVRQHFRLLEVQELAGNLNNAQSRLANTLSQLGRQRQNNQAAIQAIANQVTGRSSQFKNALSGLALPTADQVMSRIKGVETTANALDNLR